MPAASTLLPPQAVYTSEPTYRWTVEQYHKLIQDGSLSSDDPVELIEGVLVFKMPKNPPHSFVTGHLSDVITPLLPAGWHYRVQEPVTLDDGEPEPDGLIARGSRFDYLEGHPTPTDAALVIEVADSTVDRDRGIKLRSYARAGIACYWIINLVDSQVEVYTDGDATEPNPSYRTREIFESGQAVPFQLGELITQVAVDHLLPAL